MKVIPTWKLVRGQWVALGLLVSACASSQGTRAQPPVDLGSPADVHTPIGPHDGFLVGRCTVWGHAASFVQGTGSERIVPDDVKEWSEAAKTRLRSMAPGFVVASGFGRGCNGGGLTVDVDSWRTIDKVIDIVGWSLRRSDASDTITIEVTGPMYLQ
jgi:hypothetical protein